MDNDALMFAAIFVIATTIICAGVVMAAFNRMGRSEARLRKRKTGYRSSQRTIKDVM